MSPELLVLWLETKTLCTERLLHIRTGLRFNLDGCQSCVPYFLPSWVTRPVGQDVWLIEDNLTFSYSLCSPEQHAVQELTKAAVSGIGIDGEVLSYLELAQVCNSLLFTF